MGLTMGTAAAANYPAPFVVGGSADVAIVYGTGSGVSFLDTVEAGNVQSNLQSFMGSSSGSTTTTTSGEIVSLDTGASRIWINTSLNTARSSLTKSDLPTVLADTSFSGNVDATITHTVELKSGGAAGGANSGRVIFAKQPRSSDDPVMGISLGTSATSNPLYNLSATFNKAVAFNHSDSEGEDITLFGQKFTVSSATSASDLVLLKEAETVALSSDSPTATVTINEKEFNVELISASDSAATVKVTDSAGSSDSAEINEAASKTVQGLEVAVKTADETNLKLTATIIVGAEKVTLTHGSKVTTGTDNDPVDGTTVFLVGSDVDGRPSTITEIAIAVFSPGSSEDSINAGETFVDPVFGSLKLVFEGLSSPLDDSGRESIVIQNSGDDDVSITMTDEGGNTNTFDIAHNQSGQWRLGDNSNYTMGVREMANSSENDYIVIGNEEYGHVLQVEEIYNDTGSTTGNDRVKFRDISGDGSIISATSPTTEGSTTLNVDGKEYTVTYRESGDGGWTQLKYPTSDSSATQYVMYPTVQTEDGALVAFYEPLVIDLSNIRGNQASNITGFIFPDGDGYTTVAVDYRGGDGSKDEMTWMIGGTGASNYLNLTETANAESSANYTTSASGRLTYNFTNDVDTDNLTKIYVVDPEGNANIDNPAIMIFEAKNDQNNYEVIVVDLESDPAGNSDNGAGVNDILFTTEQTYGHYEATLQSDSDITKHVDWWGTLVTVDASDSDQKTATIAYPSSQVYAQIFMGESDATVASSGTTSGASQLGDVLVKDTEVSSVQSKNLIVVGGTCINSVAASVLGGAYCGSGFTDNTGVGSGEFLIESVADAYTTGKIALVVAGYEVADTVNAAKYLRTQTVDTTAGMKYKGTTSTSAELVVA